MAVSDEKLMLLEQVTYMDKDVYNKLGLTYPDDRTQILQKIQSLDDNTIGKLDGLKVDGTSITGAEWKDIIMAIRSDKELANYECVDYNQDAGAYCFANSETNEAVVAFRGTLSLNDEWPDNVISLCTSDTPAQVVALDYVNNLSQYDSVSLVGHSKGGNKAQYCAILADQVNIDKCVSMDGEGFSIEFLDKYEAQIAANSSKISDYSYKKDFVNVLLNDVPGSKQIYCDGTASGARSHFSNSMFELVQTSDGWHVVYTPTEQNESVKFLHDFSCYLCNNMPKSDRREVAEFLAKIIDMAIVKGDTDKIADYIMNNPDCAALVAGYMIKYMEENNIGIKPIRALLEEFGLANVKIFGFPLYMWISQAIDLARCDDGHWDIVDETEVFFDVIFGVGGIFSDTSKKIKKIKDKLKEGYKKANKTIRESREKRSGSIFEEIRNTVNGAFNTIIIESTKITVNPEQLKAQSDQLDLFKQSYDSIRDDIISIIKSTNDSMSVNMQNNIQMKVNILKDNLSGISDLLESGARAAGTAAINYESIDKALAKRISKL